MRTFRKWFANLKCFINSFKASPRAFLRITGQARRYLHSRNEPDSCTKERLSAFARTFKIQIDHVVNCILKICESEIEAIQQDESKPHMPKDILYINSISIIILILEEKIKYLKGILEKEEEKSGQLELFGIISNPKFLQKIKAGKL